MLFLLFGRISGQTPSAFTLRIDPDYAHGGTVSQLFDSLEFIPLETTSESLFGAVDQLEIVDSLFIILDIRSASILIFNDKGKLHAKIKAGGTDKFFNFLTIDRDHRDIVISNNFAGGLLVYDLNGRYVGKEQCPDRVETLYRFDQNHILYNIRRPSGPDPSTPVRYDLWLSKGYSNMTRYLHPYNTRTEEGGYNIFFSPLNSSGHDRTCMFSLPFDYTTYELCDTGIVAKYTFIFPLQYSLPKDFETDSSFMGERLKYVYLNPENRKKISSIERLYRMGDCLFFTARTGYMKFGVDWNYAYNLKTGGLLSFSRVSGDSASYYIPLLTNMLENIDAISSDGRLYTSIPSIRMLAIKKGIDKNITYPETLARFYSQATRNDNPVIVRARFKPNF
jgi:hypothetical protein